MADLRNIEEDIKGFLDEIRLVDWKQTRLDLLNVDIHMEDAYRSVRDTVRIFKEGEHGSDISGTDAG
jgi:hypothetical protein